VNNLKTLKNTEFKILTINPGFVAAIHVRGDPRGALRWTVSQTQPLNQD